MSTLTTIVTAAATALSLYNDLKKAAEAQGMDPDEFDKSAGEECTRLEEWKKKTDADEDSQFTK